MKWGRKKKEKRVPANSPTNAETNVGVGGIAGRRADLAASWTWRVCSPFCSRVCGASCPQCLERASPSCHYRVSRSGSTGTLLSPSWHWVKGLQGAARTPSVCQTSGWKNINCSHAYILLFIFLFIPTNILLLSIPQKANTILDPFAL